MKEAQGKKALGQFIRAKRKAATLTLQELAELSGYSLGYLSRVELGQVVDGPSEKFLRTMSDIFDCEWVEICKLAEIDEELPSFEACIGSVARNTPLSIPLLAALQSVQCPDMTMAVFLLKLEKAVGFPLSQATFEGLLNDYVAANCPEVPTRETVKLRVA